MTTKRKFGEDYWNRLIVDAKMLRDEALRVFFFDGTVIDIRDTAQYCCESESRHMHTDDDLSFLRGHVLLKMEIKDGGVQQDEEGEYAYAQFLEITTSGGFITVVNYNYHSGYYRGFDVQIDMITTEGNDDDGG